MYHNFPAFFHVNLRHGKGMAGQARAADLLMMHWQVTENDVMPETEYLKCAFLIVD